MSLDVTNILDQIVSHALTLGVFESVNTHEPKNAPGTGITSAVWLQNLQPIRGSGLDSTSIRIEFRVRIYQNMTAEPQDATDPAMLTALAALMGAYTGAFTLGGIARAVDLIGIYGPPMGAVAGYVNHSGTLYRILDLTLPIITNDTFDQDA